MGGGEGEGSSEGFPDGLHIFTDLEKNVVKFLAKSFLRSKSRMHALTSQERIGVGATGADPNLIPKLNRIAENTVLNWLRKGSKVQRFKGWCIRSQHGIA